MHAIFNTCGRIIAFLQNMQKECKENALNTKNNNKKFFQKWHTSCISIRIDYIMEEHMWWLLAVAYFVCIFMIIRFIKIGNDSDEIIESFEEIRMGKKLSNDFKKVA